MSPFHNFYRIQTIDNNAEQQKAKMSDAMKVYLITGCSSGIGAALAEHFLETGNYVVVTARKIDSIQKYQENYPKTSFVLALDVTNQDSIRNAIDRTMEKFKRIDVLINNAGMSVYNAAEYYTEEEVRAVMETNFFGALFLTQRVLPVMREQKSGRIVQMSSMLGQFPSPSCSLYSASKFALEGFSLAVGQEVAHLGIRVIIVEPGAFPSSLTSKSPQPAREYVGHYPILEQASQFRQLLAGNESGDLHKMIKSLDTIINSEDPPVQIAFGSDAYHCIKANLTRQLAERKKWKETTVATDLDPMPETNGNLLNQFLARVRQ